MAVRFASADTAVVRITGEDAAAFLQGQCTADLRGVALTDALWLNRKGRVLAHTVVAKEADGSFLLLCPHLAAEALIAVVTANVIADDVVATDETAAWGRWIAWGAEPALADARLFPTRRFGVDATYDEKTFIVAKKGLSGFLDHESTKADKIKPEIAELFAGVNPAVGGCLIIHGWTMTEDLLKLGKLK